MTKPMTRSGAIVVLHRIKHFGLHDDEEDALDLAITALSEPTVANCDSRDFPKCREALIKPTLKLPERMKGIYCGDDTCSYCEQYVEGFNNCLDEVERMNR